MRKKLVILSGPSCVGKSPLLRALRRVHPEIEFGRITLYTSRSPRPGERDGVDYHFRSAEFIQGLPRDRYLVGKTRNIVQAVDLQEIEGLWERWNLIIGDLFYTLGRGLISHPRVRDAPYEIEVKTVFLSPLSEDEITALVKHSPQLSPRDVVARVMLRKLLRRALQQNHSLTLEALEDINVRAASAYEEMTGAKDYTDIIVNHDGEESDNWLYTPPIGEAGKTLEAFVEIIS
ncbi:MAG: hypothetical protein ACUVXI_11315 [bacterium]